MKQINYYTELQKPLLCNQRYTKDSIFKKRKKTIKTCTATFANSFGVKSKALSLITARNRFSNKRNHRKNDYRSRHYPAADRIDLHCRIYSFIFRYTKSPDGLFTIRAFFCLIEDKIILFFRHLHFLSRLPEIDQSGINALFKIFI